ncbi:MAG: hypothetical protein ACOC1L_01120 [Bacillota bacterium]
MRFEYIFILSMGTILMFVTYAVNVLDYYLSLLSGMSFLLAIVFLIMSMPWLFLISVIVGILFIFAVRFYQKVFDH